MEKRGLETALVQFPRRLHDQDANLAAALDTLEKIERADIVSFSEVWMGAVVLEAPQVESLLAALAAAAARKHFMVLTGGLFMKRGDSVMDVCHIIGADGRVIGEQSKLFPSGAIGERVFCSGGEGLAVFECAGWRCAAAVCVDLFYPEIARELALAGVEVIFNPANIPALRNDMWHGLVRTRAAENTVFVAYVNNTNTTYMDGRAVAGESLIAGPTGDVIAVAGPEPVVLRATLDPGRIPDQRSRWPYLEDAKKLRATGEPDMRIIELTA